MRTIKQIADEIGVSKDKVKYQVRKLPSYCLVKEGNITHVTDDGVAIVKGLLLGNKINIPQFFSDQIPTPLPTGDAKRIIELEAEVERLKWRVEYERATTEEKMAMIQGLKEDNAFLKEQLIATQEALRIEQALHANTKGIPLLSMASADPAEPTTPMGFRQRIKILFSGRS